jgi:hypothetical protein
MVKVNKSNITNNSIITVTTTNGKNDETIERNNSYHQNNEIEINNDNDNESNSSNEYDDVNEEEVDKLLKGTVKKDKKDKKKEPQSIKIKRYIAFLLTLHYFWHLLILMLGYYMNWISLFFYWEIPLYIFLSFLNIILEMLFNNPNKVSPVPLYNSLLPYAFFLILTREKHQLYNLLWFTSITIIYSQKAMKNLLIHLLIFSLLYTAIYAIYICVINQYFYDDVLVAKIVWLVEAKAKNYQIFSKRLHEILLESSFSFIYVVIILVIIYILKYSSNNYKKKTELKENILYLIKENKNLNEIQKEKLYKNLNQDQFLYKVVSVLDNIKKKNIYNHQLVNDIDKAIFIILSNKYIFDNFDIEENNNIEVYRYLNVITDFDSAYSFSTIKNDENEDNKNNIIKSSNENSNLSLPIIKSISVNIYEIEEHIKTMMDWNFDIFKLSDLSNRQPIFYLGKQIFEKHNFLKHFNIKLSTLEAFLTKMENQYHMSLPYHNNIHAADVLHAMNYFISHPYLDKTLTIEEKFACIISAIAHDIDHPGVNNSYEIKHSEPLSIIYNNKSVLENHHCALTFKILHEYPECNIFKNLSKTQYTYIRSLIIGMILATDMACHKKYIDEFLEKFNNHTFDIENSKDRKLLLCILIKCADISNPTKIKKIAIQWSNRLFKENQIQSINEQRQSHFTLSPLINKNCTSKSDNQTSFIRIFVKPIFELLGSYLNVDNFIALKQLEDNYDFWENYNG